MIVRETHDGLLLIAQPDHAALAGRIVEAWKSDGFPALPKRDLVLTAVHEHDNGWREEDHQPRIGDDGRVLDFLTAPTPVRQQMWPRGVSRLRPTPYAAALVAQHSVSVFDRYRGDPAWQDFFATMESLRGECLRESHSTMDELSRDYLFVNVGDTASLIFCNGWTTPQRIAHYDLTLNGSHLTIAPDPFGGEEVPLTISARQLPTSGFPSVAAAIAAFEAAPTIELAGVVSGPK